jgi:light-regulated signal transduction histidine kinase (bacteriophytochrome)
MTRMIKDLLAFSRSSHAGLEPAVDFAMADVVQEALWNLQTAIEENDAVVEYNGLPRLFGRQRELTPVMQNLISNAIKYRSAARPQIRISATRGDGEWVFCLADNGLGFEQQHAEKVFGVFQRLHGRNYPGTGIGLAICKRIVERNGGRMWVISEPGLGSRFYFTLPGPTVSAPPSA